MNKFLITFTICIVVLNAVIAEEVGLGSPCACPKNIDYVCGTDSRTYSNPCMLECAKSQTDDSTLKIARKGECSQGLGVKETQPDTPCGCPKVLDLVCGSDGVTYPNPCWLECEKSFMEDQEKENSLEIVKQGPCDDNLV